MKHRFLLDENILYYAVRIRDEHGRSIPEASELIALITLNCHSIVIDKILYNCYVAHLEKIEYNRDYPKWNGTLQMIHDFFSLKLKRDLDFDAVIQPLEEEEIYPGKDIHIIRAMAHFQTNLICIDDELQRSINNSPFFQDLGLKAFHPRDALVLAQDT